MARFRLKNDTPVRWLAAFVGAAALAMALAVAISAMAGGSDPAPTPTTKAQGSLNLDRLPRSIGGPDSPDARPARALTDRPVKIARADPTGAFDWPVRGSLEQGISPWHPGLDIGTAMGVSVRASRDGTVTFVGGDPCCSYGINIVIKHDDGWSTRYAHFGSVRVTAGQQVSQGDIIGTVGVTGYTTGPHLHFEILRYGAPVDPLDQLPGGEGLYAPVGGPPRASLAEANGAANSDQPGGRPEPSPTPEPRPTSAFPDVAISLASDFLNASGEYTVVLGTCAAAPATGSQWFVTCTVRDAGCGGTSCVGTRLVCVLEAPVTVWAC